MMILVKMLIKVHHYELYLIKLFPRSDITRLLQKLLEIFPKPVWKHLWKKAQKCKNIQHTLCKGKGEKYEKSNEDSFWSLPNKFCPDVIVQNLLLQKMKIITRNIKYNPHFLLFGNSLKIKCLKRKDLNSWARQQFLPSGQSVESSNTL